MAIALPRGSLVEPLAVRGEHPRCGELARPTKGLAVDIALHEPFSLLSLQIPGKIFKQTPQMPYRSGCG